MKKTRNIVLAPRKSILEPEVAVRLQRLAKDHEFDNELTFLVNVWGVLLSSERWARTVNAEEDEVEAVEWIERAWAKDHLKCAWSADFIKGSIPPWEFGKEIAEQLYSNIPRIRNPRPDLTYGLHQDAFTAAQEWSIPSTGPVCVRTLTIPDYV